MSAQHLASQRLLTGEDVLAARQLARTTAAALQLDVLSQTRLATAVSEVARAAQLAGDPHASIDVSVLRTGARASLLVEVHVPSGVPQQLARGSSSFVVASRLMDRVTTGATSVLLEKTMATAPTRSQVAGVRSQLVAEPQVDALTVLQSQNDELTAALTRGQVNESELARVNLELDETNRGVVALYTELQERNEQLRLAQRLVFEELERAFCPAPPQVPGVELGVRYLPSQVDSPTGGDLYDWLLLEDGRLHITVVDAVGHGVTSTRDALQVVHALRTMVLVDDDLSEMLARVDALMSKVGDDACATVLLAQLDPDSGTLRMAGGGHPPPLLLRADGSVEYVELFGRPVGYPMAGSDREIEIQLGPHDGVLLYTDGLVEQTRDIVEGLRNLESAATRISGSVEQPLETLLDELLASLGGSGGRDDDTLLLAARWLPGQEP